MARTYSILVVCVLASVVCFACAQSLVSDPDAVRAAYELVREDGNNVNWLLLKYEGKNVVLVGTGSDYDDFLAALSDDERAYGYVRMEDNDRVRFVFITWIGPAVSPLKKAKVSTDKIFVKALMPQFDKEELAANKEELSLSNIRKLLGFDSRSLVMTLKDYVSEVKAQQERELEDLVLKRLMEQLQQADE